MPGKSDWLSKALMSSLAYPTHELESGMRMGEGRCMSNCLTPKSDAGKFNICIVSRYLTKNSSRSMK